MSVRSNSWNSQNFGTAASRSSTRSFSPPFGLDDDENMSEFPDDFSANSHESRGFRDGGPKEARLKRVALLSLAKEVDHLHPVKVENIPETVNEQKLTEMFKQHGEIGDIYIPFNYSTHRPASNFAVVRFKSPHAKEEVFDYPKTIGSMDGKELSVSPVSKQRSFFTNGTGYHGICNTPVEDGTYDRRPHTVKQDVTLASCRSRSGYPWGSVRELKYLPPHLPVEAFESFTIRLDNLPKHVTQEDIQEKFEKFGKITAVNCPKPIVVTQQIKDPNIGYAFVRFEDKRDREVALKAFNAGEISFHDSKVSVKPLVPAFWPTEQTRRFY